MRSSGVCSPSYAKLTVKSKTPEHGNGAGTPRIVPRASSSLTHFQPLPGTGRFWGTARLQLRSSHFTTRWREAWVNALAHPRHIVSCWRCRRWKLCCIPVAPGLVGQSRYISCTGEAFTIDPPGGILNQVLAGSFDVSSTALCAVSAIKQLRAGQVPRFVVALYNLQPYT